MIQVHDFCGRSCRPRVAYRLVVVHLRRRHQKNKIKINNSFPLLKQNCIELSSNIFPLIIVSSQESIDDTNVGSRRASSVVRLLKYRLYYPTYVHILILVVNLRWVTVANQTMWVIYLTMLHLGFTLQRPQHAA